MTRTPASQSRIARRFAQLAQRGDGALVPFVVAGDPDLDVTLRVMRALARAGADVLELGVPFSDPLADGPVNQAAYDRALRAGATVEGVLGLVARFRAESETPVVLMTYSNPVAQYGWEKFADAAAHAGVDGVLLTDLPPEEAEAWLEHTRAAGLDTIFLLAPTSPDERIELVGRLASGYVYCVSRLGVTGARDQLPPEARALVERVRAKVELPIVVGFGLSRPEQVRAVCEFADGAVVGSALVELIAQHAATNELGATSPEVAGSSRGLETARPLEQVVESFAAALKQAATP